MYIHNTCITRVCHIYNLFMSELEGLLVDDSCSTIIILLLGHPHLLEGIEGCQNGATHPRGVETILRSGYSDFDVFWSHFFCFREEPISKPYKEGDRKGGMEKEQGEMQQAPM